MLLDGEGDMRPPGSITGYGGRGTSTVSQDDISCRSGPPGLKGNYIAGIIRTIDRQIRSESSGDLCAHVGSSSVRVYPGDGVTVAARTYGYAVGQPFGDGLLFGVGNIGGHITGGGAQIGVIDIALKGIGSDGRHDAQDSDDDDQFDERKAPPIICLFPVHINHTVLFNNPHYRSDQKGNQGILKYRKPGTAPDFSLSFLG